MLLAKCLAPRRSRAWAWWHTSQPANSVSTGRLGGFAQVSDTATAASDAGNKYDFQVANLTQTNNLLASAKSTNGAEIAANTVYDLGPDQNRQVAANDVLELQITKTGAPTDLSGAEVAVVVEYDLVQDS